MRYNGLNRLCALTSACVMSLIATAGWSQSITWFGGNQLPYPHGVSADGAVVVGRMTNSAGWYRAFRWTAAGGMQDLGVLPGFTHSEAFGVSADGSVVVGWAENASGQGRAFRWTAAGGMQDLGTLGGSWSVAYGVSADGSVVVGWAWSAGGGRRAFRWTAAGGMQDLSMQGFESWAYGVSANGSIVVGRSYFGAFYGAFRWTAAGGMENLTSAYANLLTNGSRLDEARAISANGRYIVGRGVNAATWREEVYLLDTQPSCTTHNGDVDNNRCVDDADLLAVLFAFGSTGSNLGRVDVNCDQTVDDADLLQVLFNFGSGC